MATGGTEIEQRLAAAMKVPVLYLLEITTGQIRCPFDLAEKLEQRTGVSRDVWTRGSVDEIKAAVAGLWVG